MDGGDSGTADSWKSHPEEKKLWHPSNTWDPAPVSFSGYLENKSKPQIRELLQKFPGIQEIWFDSPKKVTREQSFDFYKLAYDIQPSCLINSRVGNDMGDFWIPGDNKIPANGEDVGRYWETPGTLNNTWGFKSYDVDWKSTEELLYWITEITSKGGNYLLNVGPTAEGLFPEESIEQLKVIGDWMEVNGESVYGTRKWLISHEGPTKISMKGTNDREEHGFKTNFTDKDFWFSIKGNFLYVTSLKWPDNERVLIKSLTQLSVEMANKIKSVEMLGCNKKVIWEMKKDGLDILLPSCKPNMNGYVLKIEIKK